MFNLGPMELLVLAIVGLVVIGPEKLPGLARDAANMLRTLRELATGARQQLKDELGPEFADVDLRTLNPRTAVSKYVFGDEVDFSKLNPRTAVRDAVFGDGDGSNPRAAFRDVRDSYFAMDDEPSVNGHGANGSSGAVDFSKPAAAPRREPGSRPRPRPRPSYDDDIT
jgi:sec-independent protein translocase protein TatB